MHLLPGGWTVDMLKVTVLHRAWFNKKNLKVNKNVTASIISDRSNSTESVIEM
jgi:hypothetical protein